MGDEIVPNSDEPGVYYTDTITLESSTIVEDSVPSGKNFNGNTFLAGSYDDAVLSTTNKFGFTSAGFVTQFQINQYSPIPTNSVNTTLDSVVLCLAYKTSFYGPDTNNQKLYVFQLTDNLNVDSSYYSNRTPGYNSTLLNTPAEFTVHRTDSVRVDGDTVAPHLRIPLNVSSIVGVGSMIDNNYLNTGFKDAFKGLYITGDTMPNMPGNPAKGIIGFDYSNAQTKIQVYYHNDTDTLTYKCIINSSCANYNRFIHNYSMTILNGHFGDYSFGRDSIYVHSMAGVKAKINFPYLENFKALGNIAINKAEIITKAIVPSNDLSPAPKLIILAVESDSKGSVLPDFFDQGTFGGSISNNEYHINITRHFQNLINGTHENNGLYLAVPTDALYNTTTNASNTPSQTILGGSGNSTKKLRLLITYTKLNN